MPDLLRLTNGTGLGQLIAQVNRLCEWAFGSPLVAAGDVTVPGTLTAGNVTTGNLTATNLTATNLTATNLTASSALSIGANATPPRLRSTPSESQSLNVEAPGGSVYVSGKNGSVLGGNGWWNGTNWQRYDVAQPTTLVAATPTAIAMYGAPSGANPATYTQYFGLTAAGALTLPAGSINTAMIAVNAVQQLIGSFVGASGWAATAPAAWNESAVQVTVTCSGAPCRIEFCISISANTATAYSRVGVGMDGGILAALLTNHYPTANMIQALSGVYYVTPPAGVHRFAVFVLPNTGVMTLDGGTTHTLFVTEQKR